MKKSNRSNSPRMKRIFRNILLFFSALSALPAQAQDLDLRFELKANLRSSDQIRFRSGFPFPEGVSTNGNPGVFIETVEEGEHAEVSLASVAGNWKFADNWQLQFKVDAIDLYDRNPTSGDNKIDIDALILRYGQKSEAAKIPLSNDYYAQLGKFKKFEQQRERRTESYGVVSTAFNRFEDSGIEAGFDLRSGVYGRASLTTGNPVFIRDVNALAGDNGTEEFRNAGTGSVNTRFNSGIVTLYDAEVEGFDLSSEPEIGVGLGYRWNSLDKNRRFDILVHHYERELAETRELTGTFYGGDLDLLDLSEVLRTEGARLPFEGDDKSESGLTAWYNAGDFSIFSQYVSQDLAGLDRDGFEVELSYVFDFPITVSPVLRYSELNNNFNSPRTFPTPSLQWNWRKIDYGLNLDFSDSLRLIIEYADNQLETAGGRENQNEWLITLRWRQSYRR